MFGVQRHGRIYQASLIRFESEVSAHVFCSFVDRQEQDLALYFFPAFGGLGDVDGELRGADVFGGLFGLSFFGGPAYLGAGFTLCPDRAAQGFRRLIRLRCR